MGRSINKVQLIGSLGGDVEVKQLPNGNAVANISLATDEGYVEKATGNKVDKTEWHRLVVYGKLAEICGQYLKKGSKAFFEGKLATRQWEKDGVKMYTTEIVANEMMMLDSRPANDMNQGMNTQAYAAPQAQPMQQAAPQMQQAAPQMQQAPQMAQPAPQMAQPAPQMAQNNGYAAPQAPAQGGGMGDLEDIPF